MKKVKLGEIADVFRGKTITKKETKNGNIPVVAGGLDFAYYHNEFNQEAYVITCSGSGANAGYINFWKEKIWASDCSTIRGNQEITNQFFLFYLLKNKQSDIYNLQKGSAQPHVYPEQLKDIEISLPDLPTQTAIARILSSLDDKIELNNKINKELENLARTIYEYWFVQNAGEKWERKSLGEYIQSTGGFAFKSTEWKNEGYPTIKIKDIQEDNTLNFNGIDYVSKDTSIDDKFVAKAGEVVIAMTGATIGKVAVVPFHSDKIYVNQRVGIFKSPNPLEKLPFLINSLNQNYVREMIFLIASGAAQPNISNEQINSIPLVIPNEELIKKYNDMMKSSYIQILNNQQENAELSRLRDFLLPLLMNGQVRVKT